MKKLRILRRLGNVFVVLAAFVLIGTGLSKLTYAASASLALSSNSGSYTVGNSFSVTITENSGSDAAIGVDAFVNYPASELQFISATSVAPFNVAPPDSPSGNTIEITRGAYSGQTGLQTVSVMTFKVISAGSATIDFNNSQSSISPASGNGNLLVSSSGGSYSLKAVAAPAPTPTPTPVSNPNPAPITHPVAPPSAPNSNPKSTSVSIAPNPAGSDSAVTVPDNGSVAVSTPVSVQPATIQPDGIIKVQYYFGNKLVDTESKPPYKYNIDTRKYKNGSYNLVSKSYYQNGFTKQATQHLDIKNAAEHTSNSAWTLTTAGLILLLALGCIYIIRHFRGPKNQSFAYADMPQQTSVQKVQAAPIIDTMPNIPQDSSSLTDSIAPPPVDTSSSVPAPGDVVTPKENLE